jgi:alginate O-acetyltransferase complex protein AlgI
MAIGLARMFGFRFPENFNYPYAADSIQDFWRRWHMTLSAWFRDYVYIPLGGNRLGPWDTVRNLWLVFLLTGVWHGASWNFVIWGLWHGMFLSLERLGPVAWAMERMPRVLRTAYVLLIVLIGWVFFRAATLDQALLLLKRMIVTPAGATDLIDVFVMVTPRTLVMLALAFTLTLPLWPLVRDRWQQFIEQRRPMLGDLASAAYVAFVMLLAFGAIASEQNSPFLYFRF